MKQACQLLIMIFCAVVSPAQKTNLIIPEFRNLNPNDEYPNKSLVAAYSGTFDVLIALRGYSNWGWFERKSTVLAHKENGWYKLNISSSYIYSDTSTTKIVIIKMDNKIGDSLWNILIENHLFDMEDERTKKAECSSMIFDGGEYEFQILTANKYKKIYSYSPQFFEERCPGMAERKWVINCLKAFEKYLGK